MNVERWVAARQIYWQKLEDLLKRVETRGLASLTREELQSLGRLYRSAASDLSRARVMGLGHEIIGYLNNLVVKGHNQVYQSPNRRWSDFWHFLWITFPALYRNNIIYVLVSFLLFAVPMVGTWVMIVKDPSCAQLELQRGQPIVSDELWSYMEQNKMWTDAIEGESPASSSFIATNNIKVSLIAYVLGVTFGLGTIYILVTNGIMIGGTFAACQLHGMAARLVAFVAPHGVFELSAIFISGAAGLMIAKGILFPGELRRSDSIKLMAREGSVLFLGTVPLLLIAGTIEGFISPRTDLSPEYKFAVSFATFFLLLLYLFYPRETKSESK
ncbi:MAG: stage II sporulation protein M [Candidatus Obscuribacterales bacterium]|nr:stage II sporulation protein M [Candidatus Obscuribacterales bacterium]